MTSTPPPPPPPARDTPPNAPVKLPGPPGRGEAWAHVVGSMRAMSAEQARRMDPRDIGVHVGPVMDEAQFAAYCKARRGRVTVVKNLDGSRS